MNDINQISVPGVTVDVPVMDQELFAQKIGVTETTVRGMIETNKLPSIKIGKRRLVNLAELTKRCLAIKQNTSK